MKTSRKIPATLGRRRSGLDEPASELLRQEREQLLEAQRDLEVSRQHYADLYDLAPVGFITLTTNGCICDINIAGAAMLGRDRSHLMGRPLMPLFIKPDRIKFLRHLTQLRRGETQVSAELTIADRNSHTTAVQLVSTLTTPSLKSDAQFHMAMLDITARKRAVEALQEARSLLERRVRQRTAELRKANRELQRQIAERKRLEETVLSVSEEEQQRIGRDLHDGVGQQLAGISFMAEALHEYLRARSPKHAREAGKLVKHIKRARDLTHDLARGLFPVQLTTEGLASALRELANNIEEIFTVDCRVECERAVELPDENVARHLYRIAQEAVHNAVKHSKGKCIHIELVERDHHVTLTVKDDGRGFSKSVSKPGHLGLHIMEYRAKIIGAMLDIRSAPGKGTIVTCSLNRPRPSHEEKSPR